MKLMISVLLMLGFSNVANASLFPCEDVVKMSVASELQKQGLNDVVANVEFLDESSNEFYTLKTWRVLTTKPNTGEIGIPYAATWMVIVKDEMTSSGCHTLGVFHDITAL